MADPSVPARSGLLRAGLWLSAGITLGRFAGFVREAILARTYGVGPEGDVAAAVLTLPDALVNIVVGSAMATALVPRLAQLRSEGGQSAVDRLHAQVAVVSLVVGVVLTIALIAGAGGWLPWYYHGDADHLPEIASHLALALWVVPLSLLSAVVGAGLQERERFASTALGTLWFNGAVIAGLVAGGGSLTVFALAMVLGAALRCGGQVWEWLRVGGGWIVGGGWLPDRRLLVTYVEALVPSLLVVLVPILALPFASLCGTGGFSAFNYAVKLYALPQQVLMTVLGTLVFTRCARLLAAGDEAAARTLLARGGALTLILAIAGGAALAWAAPSAVAVAFGAKAAGVEDAVRVLALALPAAAHAGLLTAWHAAAGRTRIGAVAGMAGAGLFILGGWPVARWWGLPGLAGLMVAQQAVTHLVLLRAGGCGGGWRGPLATLVVACTGLALAQVLCGLSPWGTMPIVRLAAAAGVAVLAIAAGAAAVPGVRSMLRRS